MNNFLTENKIYFETIATSTIAIMAVIVSIVALNISSKANDIAASSLNINKLALLPKISAEFKFAGSEDGNRSEILVISNSGDVMYEFHSYPFAFFRMNELKLITPENSNKTVYLQNVVVPVVNYFPISSFVANVNKGVFSERHISNTQQLDPAVRQFSQSFTKENKSIGGAIERYLFVSYIDQFGDKHEKYMRFDPFGTSVPLTENEGKELLYASYQKFKTNDALVLDYEQTTSDDLQRVWNQSVKKVVAVK